VKEAAARLDLTKAIASGAAPKVTITSVQNGASTTDAELSVEASVSDQGGGIGRIEWRVNGVTLGVDSRGLGRTGQDSAVPGKTMTVRQTLSISPGENVIEIVAYNAKDWIASMPATVKIVREGRPEAFRPRLHVVAVGVNDYWDSGLRLNFAVTDARALGDALRQSGAQLYESVGDRGRALVGRNHSADPRASASTSTQALCALLAELPVSRTQVRDAPSRT
jgi:hypothetical protein